ncbi:helix-turn-helix domain-containing protein [Actinomadura sp. ATCC 31491]|uniref:Helix-turn-helix domain-containing protein n=1 Tax=Actinomadura luzonensis TaxID=2805427 RepID=A0ABT0G4E2_9ACTN|nr:helix-turn-helix domain-containing protein [Actinomadura luzonensis]MCK2219469.1 helix-turn-helix domain-containing protein [Actinomadura luzonensis]
MPVAASWDWARVEVAVPGAGVRLPGVAMAGFRQRVASAAELAMVAHPSVTVLVDLSDDGAVVFESGGRRVRGSAVIGLLPGQVRAAGPGTGDCLQVRLEPAVAAAVLGGAAELSGSVVPLEEVWGHDAARLRERLRAASSWQARFVVVAELLARRLEAGPAVDAEVGHVWGRLLRSRGRLRVDGLAQEVGWSRQRLWSRFRAQVGLSPKRAARLVRFDRAARLLAAGRPPAGVAAHAGYVDQSHLHREVRTFTGLTPAEVAAAPWLGIDEVAWPATP